MNPTRMTKVGLTAACLLAAIALLTVGAEAVEVRWTAGGGNFSWQDGWNWHTGSAPVAGDKIVFDDDYTPGGNCGIDMAGATLTLGSASMGYGYGGRNWSYYDSATLTPNNNPLANPTDFNLGGYASLEAAAAASGQVLTVQTMDWSKSGNPRFFIPVVVTGSMKNPENGPMYFYGPAAIGTDDIPRNRGWTADLRYYGDATIGSKITSTNRGVSDGEQTRFYGVTTIGDVTHQSGRIYFMDTSSGTVTTLTQSGSSEVVMNTTAVTVTNYNWNGGTYVAGADGTLAPLGATPTVNAGQALSIGVAQTVLVPTNITVKAGGALAGNMSHAVYSGAGQNVTFENDAVFNEGVPPPGGALTKADLDPGVMLWLGVTTTQGTGDYWEAGDDGTSPYKGLAMDPVWSQTGEWRGTFKALPGSGDLLFRVTNRRFGIHYSGGPKFYGDSSAIGVGDNTSSTAVFTMDAAGGMSMRRHFNKHSQGDPDRIKTFTFTRPAGNERNEILSPNQEAGIYADQTINIFNGKFRQTCSDWLLEGALNLTNAAWTMDGEAYDATEDTGTVTLAGRTTLELPTADAMNHTYLEGLEDRFTYSGLPMVIFADKNGGPFIYEFDLDQTAGGTTPVLAQFLANVDYGSNHYHDVDIGGDGLLIGDGRFLADAGTTEATDAYVARNTTGTLPKILPGQPGAITMGFAAIEKNLAIGLEVDAPDATVQIGTTDPNRLITSGGAGFTPAGIPGMRVTFQQNVTAKGVAVESGTAQFNQDLNIDALSVRNGATLVMAGGKTATVSGVLSGTGIWTGGNGVLLAPGATIAPGYSVGELNKGGELLQFSDQIIYAWELGDATAGPGIGWDMLWGDPLRFVGDPTQGMIIEILDAGLTGELDGSEIFAIAAGSFEIPPELLAQVDCRTSVPGWDAGDCQVFPVLGDPDFNGEDVLYLTGLVVTEGPGPDIIPEPATLSLLGLGALALLRRRRRR